MGKLHGLRKLLPLGVPVGFTLLVASGLLMSGLFVGCEKVVHDTVTVTIHDTLLVEVITVDSVAASGALEPGASIELTAQVTKDPAAGTLTYLWYADRGKLDAVTGDTVTWKAPYDTGAFTITVHVSDGTYAGVGSRVLGVGVAPPDSANFYVSAAVCAICHTNSTTESRNKYPLWAETGHAEAWEGLQSSSYVASFCEACHTTGSKGLKDQATGDMGWDDAKLTIYQNVQCESCHGPGYEHYQTVSAAAISVSYDAAVCGDCHEGGHHPTIGEWETSGHGNATTYPMGVSYCQGCHEGVAAAIRLSGDLSDFYGSGSIADRPSTDDQPLADIVCATCHDPHDATNEHQLRTADDVVLVETGNETGSPVISDGGAGKLCMQCHHARRAAESQIAEGYAHFGPHPSPQADMLAGKSAYHAVAPTGFTWAQPSHLYIEEACVTCHMHEIEYDTLLPDSAATGHTWEPTVEACEQCHGSIASFDAIMALDDFDGDGSIEGVEDEVHGLMSMLETSLIDSFTALGITTTNWDADSLAHALGEVVHHISATDSVTVPQLYREAGYNLVFLEDDGSHGIHNPDYAVQLLQQSYKHLTGSDVPGAVIHSGDLEVVERW